jgi:PadR family transcriptional regulator PadR
VTDPSFAPLGVLEEQIVVAVLRTGGAAYGMAVRREIERVTGRELAIGAVYATLDRSRPSGCSPRAACSPRGRRGGCSRSHRPAPARSPTRA